MASFVAEVLTSAGQLESQEVTSKLQQLSKKIDSLKLQIHEMTTDKYATYLPRLHSAEQLVGDVSTLKMEMDGVSNKIENQIKSQLNTSTGEFQSLTGQLEDVTATLVILEKLAQLQGGLEAIEVAVRTHEYSKAADAVFLIKLLLAKQEHAQQDDIKILSTIMTEAYVQMQKLICDLSEKWSEMVIWTVQDQKGGETEVKTELKLNVKGDHSNLLDKVVLGMKKIEILDEKIKRFVDEFLEHIITPLMTNGACEIEETETWQAKILTVKVPLKNTVAPPLPQNMYASISKVLQFLNSSLLYVVIEEGEDENSVPLTLMEILGGLVSDQALTLAVKECLIKAIPTNHKELAEFGSIVAMTEDVHKKLLKLGFISAENTILLDFVQNVNVLFANKKCQEILEHARLLMTTEVHNSTPVSHDKPLGDLPPLVIGGKKPRRDELAVESPLSSSTFRLPACQISTSIQELMAMAYETLHEATASSPQCAIQMFCAVRNMFELFCSVFPTYHKQTLESLPQFTALFYNNCMYIAHHLMTLGHQFNKKLPANINSTFVDLVPKIRRLGTESFLQQLSKQKAQLSEYLSATNGFLTVSEKEAFLKSERAVKQILHQLQSLKKVWQEVLPVSNYRKAIGSLLNSVLVETCDGVIALEDISADDAKQLSRLLTTISDRAPEFFQVPGDDKANVTVEIQRNVAKWERFRELDLVLNGSMIDIEDRWASGKGPLAVAFSAHEVKLLIRALFQNTDRRAVMLGKIK